MSTSGMHRRPFEGRHLVWYNFTVISCLKSIKVLTFTIFLIMLILTWYLFVLLGCLSFHQPPGLLFFLSLFLPPFLIHARMPDWARAFVHGHTFLHSWSGPMTLACCMELLSCPIFLLFSSCLLNDISSWKGHLLNPTYNNKNLKL